MESRYTFMICRLCLSKSESLTDIFEDSGSHGFIAADIISDFLQLQVSKTDGYPQLVCLKCFDKLIDFKTFKAHCMSAKSIFENKFNSNTSIFHAKYSSKVSIDENAVKLDDLRLNVIKNENIDIDEDGNIFEEHNTAMEFCDVVIEAEAEDFGSEDEILQQKEIVTEDKIVSSCPVEIKEEELELSNTDTENSSTTPSQNNCVEGIYMDHFVIKHKRFRAEDSKPSNSGIAQSSNGEKVKKTKVYSFQEKWENEYFVVENFDRTGVVCLLCDRHLAGFRRSNCERHFITNHISFNMEYPPKSDARSSKLNELKLNLIAQSSNGEKVKKTKVYSFQEKWEIEYFVVENFDRTGVVCLLCDRHLAGFRRSNCERHFKTNHISFNMEYPPESDARSSKLNELKLNLMKNMKQTNKLQDENTIATRISCEISHILDVHSKSLSNREIIKKCIVSTVNMLSETLPDKHKLMLVYTANNIPIQQ